jgi:hypothetical protein
MAGYENWHLFFDYGVGWVDVTASVDSFRAPITGGLGDGVETSEEPGVLRFLLSNPTHSFTPGNASSPMALTTGMPVRLTEQIGIFVFELHRGTIEFPEITDWAGPGLDQQIAVQSVDQLSRWERSRTFLSTLAAYVQHRGTTGTSLQGYWPLNEPSGTTFRSAFGTLPNLGLYVVDGNNYTPAQIDNANGSVAPADDLSVLRMTRVPPAAQLRLRSVSSPAITLNAGQVITAVVWVNVEPTTATLMYPLVLQLSETGPTATGFVRIAYNVTVGDIVADLTGTSLTGSTTTTGGNSAITGQPIPLALRYGYTPNTLEMWVRDKIYVAAVGGVAPTGTTITEIRVADLHNGLIGHAQLYVGAATDYTNADFVAQYHMGFEGMERQLTGARIRTIGAYMGLTDSEMPDVDAGCSVMSAARLAGKTAAEAMYEARNTEQGRLFIAGNGSLTFQDRRTILNV